nr:unnamed protein product [Callosobruchus chinensis]
MGEERKAQDEQLLGEHLFLDVQLAIVELDFVIESLLVIEEGVFFYKHVFLLCDSFICHFNLLLSAEYVYVALLQHLYCVLPLRRAKLTGRSRNCPPSSKTKSSTVCFTFAGGGRNLLSSNLNRPLLGRQHSTEFAIPISEFDKKKEKETLTAIFLLFLYISIL